MLPKLLHREWVLNRTTLLLMAGIFGAFEIFSATSVDSARAWIVMATLYAAFLTVALFVREDKFRATAWTCTLPVTRVELVRARFVAAWLMVVVALSGATVLAAIVPGGSVPVVELLDLSTLLIVATVATLIFAWVLPFTIRFGMLGIMLFLVVGQLAGATLLLVGSTINRRSGGGGRPIRAALGAIGDGLVSIREVLSPPLFAVAVVLTLIAVNWLAYRFSAYLFGRREL